MELSAARKLARELMVEHGLGDWTFHFDRARRRFGACVPARRRISLSALLTVLNSEQEVRDTILHEIAHALSPGDGHGPKWRAACVRIGAKPVRCYSDAQIVTPARRAAPLEIGCARCGWWQARYRQSRRKLVCRKCRGIVVIRRVHLSIDEH